MPFTAAHPAAAIPLARPLRGFSSVSALVVGSMVPDLAYFLPLPSLRSQSHTIAGLFAFCLPAGLVFYYLFHALVAPLAYDLAPTPLRHRLPHTWALGKAPRCPLHFVAISIVIGATTHIVWDSFTHPSGAIVMAVPALSLPLASAHGYTLFVYKALQHGSTILGLALLSWWGIGWLRRSPCNRPLAPLPPYLRALIVGLLLGPPIVAALVAALATLEPDVPPLRQLQLFVGVGIVSGGSAALVSVVLVGLGWRLVRSRAG